MSPCVIELRRQIAENEAHSQHQVLRITVTTEMFTIHQLLTTLALNISLLPLWTNCSGLLDVHNVLDFIPKKLNFIKSYNVESYPTFNTVSNLY